MFATTHRVPRLRRGTAGRTVARRAFTMIEICIAIAVMSIAMVMFSSVIASTARMGAEKRQASVAAYAARSVLERMRCMPFREVWQRFNDDPADDPGGAGSAPGRSFAIEGLSALAGDADGFVGEVVMPARERQLRENADNEALGMPRDLNGDTLIDELDHAEDYAILPVLVRVQWQGPLGPRELEMYTMLFQVSE